MTSKYQYVIALKLIFCDSDDLSIAMRNRINKATLLDHEDTGVGFYSTIKFSPPLEELPEVRIREFNFEHPAFPHGGSFMCWFIDANTIEIEAVTLGGANWPDHYDPDSFSEHIGSR